jgi:hypothetical protein
MFQFLRKKQTFEYPGIEPPFGFKPFHEMTKQEAQRHFEWFVSQSHPRRELLMHAIKATGRNPVICNYSPESLVPLWNSMSRFFESRPMSPEEKQQFNTGLPAAAKRLDKFDDLRELTTATTCYAIDIGFYFAEVFLRKYPHVQWVLWNQKGHAFNRPALSGFKLVLVPVHLVSSCIWSQLKAPKETWLFDAYKHWEEKNLLAP